MDYSVSRTVDFKGKNNIGCLTDCVIIVRISVFLVNCVGHMTGNWINVKRDKLV